MAEGAPGPGTRAGEVPAWAAQRGTCGRCGDLLARDAAVLGCWLSDREGPLRGLCPDGELHVPLAVGRAR